MSQEPMNLLNLPSLLPLIERLFYLNGCIIKLESVKPEKNIALFKIISSQSTEFTVGAKIEADADMISEFAERGELSLIDE
jgi:hypothetical protein